MTKADNAPTIGTPEAAVRSCVALIASVTGQPEELTERYLDLYYQVRRQAEDAAERERILSCWDVGAPVSVVPNDGPPRAEKTDCHTSAAALVRNDENAEKPAEKTRKKVDFDEVLASASAGAKTPKPGPWSSVKREIRERFIKLRGEGMTLAQAVNLSDGKLNDGEVLVIMNGGKAEMRVYNALEDAMNKWEKTVKAAGQAESTTN